MSESRPAEVVKLESAHAQDPDGRVFVHLAEAYRREGEWEQAREVLEHGLAQHPQYASAHVVHGRVLRDLQQLNAAEEAFRVVLDLDGRNVEALRTLGDLARERGDREEALRHYRALRAIEPFDEDLLVTITDLETGAVVGGEPAWPELGEGEPFPLEEAFGEPPEGAPAGAPPEDAYDLDFELGARAESAAPEEAEERLEDAAPQGPAPEPADLIGWDSEEWLALTPSQAEVEDLNTLSAVTEEETAANTGDAADPGPGDEAGDESVGATASERRLSIAEEVWGDVDSPPDGDQETMTERVERDEMVTETMASLYASQGLYDRAAEVVRALLQDRPQDEHLQGWLHELEGLAAHRGDAHEQRVDEGESPAAAEISVEAVESAWTGGAGAVEIEETPYAWSEDAPAEEADGDGATVGDYLGSLLRWRVESGNGAAAQEAAAPPEATGDASPELAAPAAIGAAEPVEIDAAAPAAIEVPALAPSPEPEAFAAAIPEEPQDEQEGVGADAGLLLLEDVVTESSDQAGDAISAAAFSRPAHAQADAAAVEAAFREWFDAIREADGEGTDGAPEGPAGAAEEGPEENDEDLETFRNWLQSLKQ